MNLRLQEVGEYVSGLLHNKPLPPRSVGKLSKAEIKEYSNAVQKVKETNQALKIRRRRFLAGLGIAGGALVLAIYAPGFATKVFLSPPSDSPEDFSGDVNVTRDLIHQWNHEVGVDFQKFLRYTPRISNLATAYFAKQMATEFPNIQDRYQISLLKGRFRFYTSKDYSSVNTCRENLGNAEPASTDPDTRIISVAPERLFNFTAYKEDSCLTWFLVSTHELLHSTALRRPADGYVARGTARLRNTPIEFIQGLKLFVASADNKCRTSWWWETEETVVEHGITELIAPLSIPNRESRYLPWVDAYRSQVINPLFNGRYQALLQNQQLSDIDAFMATIGSRLMGEDASLENKIGAATQLLVPMLDVKRLRQ